MNNYKNYLTIKGYSKRTISEHLNALKLFEKYLDQEGLNVVEISYTDLLGYIETLTKQQLATSTKKLRIGIIKKYFNYLSKEGMITENPVVDVQIKKETSKVMFNTLEAEELDQTYDAFNESEVALKYKVILGLIIYQGLSTSDLKRILITDINLNQCVIHLPETNRSRERIIPLNAKQVFPIVGYSNEIKGEKLFNQWIHNLLVELKKQLETQTNFKGSINDLRVSRIMLWIKQHNLRKTQYLCGFKYISSLDQYRISEVEGLRKKLEACF